MNSGVDYNVVKTVGKMNTGASHVLDGQDLRGYINGTSSFAGKIVKEEADHDGYKGKSLVCLTESPSTNFIKWAQKEYTQSGNVRKMTNTGYHDQNVWMSIIFQLMAAFAAMQKKSFCIRNFSLRKNVFIKNVASEESNSFWKYIIGGIGYYVPNHGYIVMVDSNYKDYDDKFPGANASYKIVGRFVDDKTAGILFDAGVSETIRKSLLACFDINNFGRDFVNEGGIKPPESIIKLLERLCESARTQKVFSVSTLIRQHLNKFVNNRVGTIFNEGEERGILHGANSDFKVGELVVTCDEDNTKRFGLIVEVNENSVTVMTKSNDNIFEKSFPPKTVEKYSTNNPPLQNFSSENHGLNHNPIEVYTV